MEHRPLPIGADDFKKVISKGYYYVDKTELIKELLDKKGEVNLFTRPRRFGKTLNMSMLQCFFENTGDEKANKENRFLFDGMKIMNAGEKYLSEMGRYPVISLSLKSSKQPTWKLAYACLKEAIENEFKRHMAVIPSIPVEADRKKFEAIVEHVGADEDYVTSLAFLSRQLSQCCGQPVIILIDEYDVPLENAYFCGFYQQMADFIRSLFESALKTNPSLYFAVITGCLRITKESIFTGLNNLEVISITNKDYGEYFGFVQPEVDELLSGYGFGRNEELAREWYDGYLFGDTEVSNPWSILNYVKTLCSDPEEFPMPYWSNTSSNDIVRSLIEQSDLNARDEIESLIEGKSILKPIHEDITYEDIHKSQENLWNFLFFTGYLRQVSRHLDEETMYVELAIPNKEVRYIYKNTVRGWFNEQIKGSNLSPLYTALKNGDTETISNELSSQLQGTISFYDYAENYYHGFLAGILKNMSGYKITSNRESGMGRPDIVLRTPGVRGQAIVLELKVAETFAGLEKGCDNALSQIQGQRYADGLRSDGYSNILCYGICFYRKECMVKKL